MDDIELRFLRLENRISNLRAGLIWAFNGAEDPPPEPLPTDLEELKSSQVPRDFV